MDNVIMILFMGFIIALVALDVGMVISLVKPGDERKQMVVWKASTYTLLATVGAMLINVIEKIAKTEAIAINPFTQLGATAIIYFVFLMYYKRKYGG